MSKRPLVGTLIAPISNIGFCQAPAGATRRRAASTISRRLASVGLAAATSRNTVSRSSERAGRDDATNSAERQAAKGIAHDLIKESPALRRTGAPARMIRVMARGSGAIGLEHPQLRHAR